MRRAVLLLGWLAVAGAAGAAEVFKNDWCFCLIPTIHPENPVAASHLAYGAAFMPDGRLVVAGTEPRDPKDLGSGWRVAAMDATGTKIAWSRSYVWQRSYYDVARSVAVDAAGRTVAVGYSEYAAHGPVPAAWLVAAYDKDGKPLWCDTQVRQGVVRAEAVAMDARGAVYVAGWDAKPNGVGSRWLMGKYGPSGGLQWSRTFGGVPMGQHEAHGIALDPQGNVVVVGSVDEGAARFAWCVRKYTPAGVLLWSRSTVNPLSWRDEPYAVATAPDGRIGVVGKQSGGPIERIDWAVRVYDAKGTLLWTRTHGGAEHLDDKANAVVFDRCGRLIVAGFEDGNTTEQKPPWDAGHAVVRAYDAQGEVVATLTGNDLKLSGGGAYGLAVGKTGVPVVVGYEQTPEVGKVRWAVRELTSLGCDVPPARR